MNLFSSWAMRVVFGILGILLLAILVALVWAKIEGNRIAASGRIESLNGIESLEWIQIGGVPQAIYLRGHDKAKPVLLFVHGGPGVPTMPLARNFGHPLEKHFTVVHWDQRGAGNSCSSEVSDDSLNLEQYLDDTLEVVNHLRTRFKKEKIFILGHSWGSVLSLMTVQNHPELFHAYIGMGQVVDAHRNEEVSLRFVLERAKAEENQQAIDELEEIQLPYANQEELMIQRGWLSHYGGDFTQGDSIEMIVRAVTFSPEYSIRKKLSFFPCVINSLDQAWDDIEDLDFIESAPRLEVPTFFFVGRHDYNTPFELVEEYFDVLEAPYKELIWFDRSAHMPNIEEPARYQQMLIQKVLPRTTPGNHLRMQSIFGSQ